MNTTESFEALRRANPRARTGFAEAVETTVDMVHARVVTAVAADAGMEPVARAPGAGHSRPRRGLVRAGAVGASLAVAAAMAAVLAVGSPVGGPEVANAAAAVRKAATVTAASAGDSGTAVLRITRNGELWAGTTVRWHDGDVSIARDGSRRPGKAGSRFLVVDGTLYGVDPADGGWVVLGNPERLDPDSGTTPGEYLAAVRADVGGATLRRITDAMTGLTTRRLGDGSAVYRGTVAAGAIARESAVKEGRPVRVLPFGHVAHDDAADPAAPLDTEVTVAADGIIRELTVSWGAGATAWTYRLAYRDLGETPDLVAPADARPLRRPR